MSDQIMTSCWYGCAIFSSRGLFGKSREQLHEPMQTLAECPDHWPEPAASERANCVFFLIECTEVPGLDKPLPTTDRPGPE
jgi:hypothetical protein